jgi:type VI secretion system secreted protein Hcp
MAIYMKFGSIDGAVTTKTFEKWIELTSLQWGVGRSVGSAARSATSREGSEPSISEVVVTKVFDKASNKLFQDAVGGTFESTVTLKLTTTTKDTVETFLKYELSNTGLSGYSVSSGGDKPQESLSLNFTKIQITFSDLDAKGSGSPDTVGYDLETMHKV